MNGAVTRCQKVAVASSKGGTGKSMVTSTLALAAANRGLRVLLVDLSMIAPNQEHRLGMSGATAAIPTIDELPPWSTLHQEPTSGLRVLSAPRSMTARTPEALAALVPALLAQYDGSADVVIFDLDGLSNNALHRVVLELADDLVFVLDHSAVTLDAVTRTAREIQHFDDDSRNGFPRVPVERCRFMFSDRTGLGGAERTRVAVSGLGRWVGHLSYSQRLDAVGEVGRLALAMPVPVARDADRIVAKLLKLEPSASAGMSVVDLPRSTRRLRRGDKVAGAAEPAPLGDRAMLEVFAGPLAPSEMSLVEFRVLAAVAGWQLASVETLAKMLDLPEKAVRRIVKAMVGSGLVVLDHELVSPRQLVVDVGLLAGFTRQLATTGTAPVDQVVEVLTKITQPAYGGAVGDWAFTAATGHGVPLAHRANDVLIGLAEQLALNASTMHAVARGLSGALDRAGLTDLAWRARIRAPFEDHAIVSMAPVHPHPAPVPGGGLGSVKVDLTAESSIVEPPSAVVELSEDVEDVWTLEWAWDEPPVSDVPVVVPAAAGSLGSSALVGPDAVAQVPVSTVLVAEPPEFDDDAAASVSAGRLERPRVLLRAFADGEATVVGARRPSTVQVPFALAVAQGSRTADGLEDAGVVSASTLHKAFRTDDRELVIKEKSSFMLADGVKTDYDWIKDLATEAAAVVEAGGDAGWLIREAMSELDLFQGRCYPMGGKDQVRRWRWVDAWPDGATAVVQAESGLTLALVTLSTAWVGQMGVNPDIAGSAPRLVESMLRLERTVIPGWRAQILTSAGRVAAASGRRSALDSVSSRVTQLAQNEAWTVPAELADFLGW